MFNFRLQKCKRRLKSKRNNHALFGGQRWELWNDLVAIHGVFHEKAEPTPPSAFDAVPANLRRCT